MSLLEINDLAVHFGGVKAVDGVSFSVEPGEVFAIIGPNGAGKSTLIAQICGGLRPDSGSVHLLGHDVTEQSTKARARAGLARTFQISALAMEDTVLENVLLGALGASGRPWRFWQSATSDRALRDRADGILPGDQGPRARHGGCECPCGGGSRCTTTAVPDRGPQRGHPGIPGEEGSAVPRGVTSRPGGIREQPPRSVLPT